MLGFTNQNGITGSYNAATGVLTLTGTCQRGQLPGGAALGDLLQHQRQPVERDPHDQLPGRRRAARQHASNVVTATVSVTPVNDAPVNTVPGIQEVVQNTNVTFNGAKLILISDVDVGAGTEAVALSVSHGVLSLSGTSGLSFTVGDGNTDPTMTFSGTVTEHQQCPERRSFTSRPTHLSARTP